MTQKEALDILKTGRNVFLTGAAGSGKTHVLREYISYLKKLGGDVAVTASTGIAATHMGGTTIHSWSGIGIKNSLNKHEIEEIAEKSYIRKRLRYATVLIIDEISMLHHYRLDLVDAVLRQVKESEEPFGGMQAVFCGDFFQLPPVSREGELESRFSYHSQSWKSLDLKVCYLEEQHRQNDPTYLRILNSIRENFVSEEIIEILQSRFGKKCGVLEKPTKLYSHNVDVDKENERELAKIPGEVSEYYMGERGKRKMLENLKKSCLAPETLRLKKGAKVMFVKNNFDEGYVNGTMGKVARCDFEEVAVKTLSGNLIQVERANWMIEEDGRILAEINQFPLRLAWAITVHKSQGMSLDAAEIDLGDSFERGMGYVALSRVRSLEGLSLKGLNQTALQVNEEVMEFDKTFRHLSEQNASKIKKMGEEYLLKMHNEFREKVSTDAGLKEKKKKKNTVAETRELLESGLGLREIAKARGLKECTILDHLEEIKEKEYKLQEANHIRDNIPKAKFRAIYSAFRKIGMSEEGDYKLSPVKTLLGAKYSYDDLRLVRLFL